MVRMLLPAIALLTALAPVARAHGIECDASRSGPAVLVHCSYHPSGAVRGAAVSLFGPTDPRTPYQSGRTDPEGRFAFVPDTHGVWRIVVDDQMGHREDVRLTVEDTPGPVESESTTVEHRHEEAGSDKIPLLYKILFGLSLIWGAAGLWYGFKAGTSRRETRPT